MKALPLLFACTMFLFACSSMDLPTVEQSNKRIASLRGLISDAERPLNILQQQYRTHRDLGMSLKLSAVNRITRAIAQQRTDDLIITFLPTRPLLEEKKSVLGISYTNRLDIDSGRVMLDLKRFEFLETRRGELNALLVLEGEGRLSVSGRYTGVPASVSPKIKLAIRDTARFTLSAGENGAFVLTPVKSRIMLRAEFRVSLLGWEVPWKEDIPLEIDKLLSPFTIPSFLDASILFPIPASDYDVKNYQFESVPMKLLDTIMETGDGKFIYRANVKLSS